MLEPPTHPKSCALMLSGPTGTGKTELAIELAVRLGLEIISADSMQVYRGMEIGTAQPTADERARARFHLCGEVDPTLPFDARKNLERSDEAHADIARRGGRPIYVGGTGLYLRALRWGLFDQAPPDPTLRAKLQAEVEREGPAALHERLRGVDPEAAARIATGDAARIVRALEVHAATGSTISALQRQWRTPAARFAHLLVVLVPERALLRERIERRARGMLDAGWIDETRRLMEAGVEPTAHCFKAIGYREIAEFLGGAHDRDELERRIIAATWQFARRQLVWFRRERPAAWLSIDRRGVAPLIAPLEKLLAKLEKPFV